MVESSGHSYPTIPKNGRDVTFSASRPLRFMEKSGTIIVMHTLLRDTRLIWEWLPGQGKPVALYGMGDGGDKALAACREYGVPVAGVFASDGFVRGQVFRGFPVETLADLEDRLGEMVVLLCFATARPEVLENIRRISLRHTLLAPDLPLADDILVTTGFLAEHLPRFEEAISLLADDQSRDTLRDILRFKLSGELRYLERCETPRDADYLQLLAPGGQEVFVDAGAYNGDTVEEFLGHTGGRFREIYALEPNPRNFRKLDERVKELGLPGIRCLRVGAWDSADILPFSPGSGRQSGVAEAGSSTPVDSIDNILGGRPATILKYDVEGAERRALLGSRRTIAEYKPRLAVSAYHRAEDLFALPRLIHSLHPGYKIYLRRHPCVPAWDTNLYAV